MIALIADPAAKPSLSFSSLVLSGEFEEILGIFECCRDPAAMDTSGSPTPLTSLMDVEVRSTKKAIFFVKWRNFPLPIAV